MRGFGHQVTGVEVVLQSMWWPLLDIMQHWALKMKHSDRSVRCVSSWPGSWLGWPLWCGRPPVGTSYGLSWRFLWPLSEQTPGSSHAQQLHASAFPVWAVHILSLHYHIPAMEITEYIDRITNTILFIILIYKQSFICNLCEEKKILKTCLWTLVSCSRLFSRKIIFCFCARLPPDSSVSNSALYKTEFIYFFPTGGSYTVYIESFKKQ